MRTTIELQVKTTTALHIGSRAEGSTDSLFRRDSNDRLLVPGTSIAGALRSHLTRIAPAFTHHICTVLQKNVNTERPAPPCRCPICHLMGDVNPVNVLRDTPLSNEDFKNYVREYNPFGIESGQILNNAEYEWLTGRASRLIIHDTVIKRDGELSTRIRDGVGIERYTHTAARAAASKFDLETVPAGVEFTICMELEAANEMDKALLRLALEEWKQGLIRLGGDSSRGLGALEVIDVVVSGLDIERSLDDFMAFINGDAARNIDNWDQWGKLLLEEQHHTAYQDVEGSVQSWMAVDLEIKIDGFFLLDDATQALGQGYSRLSTGIIPGSSLRGVLRSHAEAIARTMVNLDVDSEQEFLDRCPAADPLAMRVNDEDIVYLESLRSRLRHSPAAEQVAKDLRENPYRIEDFFDCADRLFGNTYQGSRLMVEDAYLTDDSPVIWKPLDFVAIDRFTGGSADQKKFDAMALWRPTFKTRLMLEAPQEWEIGWLLMVLRDLSDGLITMGAGGSKGCGHVRSARTSFKFGWSHPEAFTIQSDLGSLQDSSIWTTSDTYTLETLPVIRTCIEKWHQHLDTFRVHPDVQHRDSSDPYWGKYHQNYRIDELYQREISLNEH